MDKRFHHSSLNPNYKDASYMEEDRISQLPDEIIVSVLYKLPLKEAARTSVLSRRWKSLWPLFSRLIFDGSKTKWDIKYRLRVLRDKQKGFIRLVNQVVDSYKGSNLDDFVVCFDLGKWYSAHLDKWINFALTKEVKRLEIDLTPFIFRHKSMFYDFPVDFCCGLSSIGFVKSLCFKFVNINGEVIQHCLLSCPLLKELCVHCSEHLLDLKVVGSSLRLKYLEIKACPNLKSMEICAPNLVSFCYGGEEIILQVQNLPRLVDLTIGAPYGHHITHAFGPFSSYFSQLDTLTFDMHLHKKNMDFLGLPEFTNLRHLIVKVSKNEYDCLPGLSQLIKLSPSLHKFTLELLWLGRSITRKLKNDIKCPHEYLKVVEFIGFAGVSVDTELVKFFIENAIMLEKIIMDTRDPAFLNHPKEFQKGKWIYGARRRAEQLKTELPPGVELLII